MFFCVFPLFISIGGWELGLTLTSSLRYSHTLSLSLSLTLSLSHTTLTAIIVGFSNTSYSGREGSSVEVCVMILEGNLSNDITLSYLIGAPREENSLDPTGLPPDTAIGIEI